MRKLFFGLIVGVVFLSSCFEVEDKGNYTYTDLNAVVFDGEATRTFDVIFDETVEIPASVKETTDPAMGDTFTYTWYGVSGNSYEKLFETTDRVLRFKVDRMSYPRISLRVKNNRTGVVYSDNATWTFNVVQNYTTGFVFLTQKDANTIGLDMWDNFRGVYNLEKNLFEIPAEADRFPVEGRGIDIVAVNNSPTTDNGNQYAQYFPRWPIFVLKDNYTGIFDHQTFARSRTLTQTMSKFSLYHTGSDMVATRMITQGVKGNGMLSRGAAAFFVPKADDPEHGNWFWFGMTYNTTTVSYPWENAVNVLAANYEKPVGNEEPMSKHAALVPGNSLNLLVMWSDAKQKFFVKVNSGTSTNFTGYLTSKWMEDVDVEGSDDVLISGDAFKIAEPGRKMLYMASSSGGVVYAVVNDPGVGHRFIYLTDPKAAGTFTKGNVYNFPAGTEVGTAKFFATGWPLDSWPYLYFVTADAKRVKAFALAPGGTEETVALATPADHEIVAFKAFGPELNYSGTQMPTQVFVVTRDPSLPDDQCCTFTVYDRVAPGTALKIATYDKVVDDGNGGTTTVPTPMQVSGIGRTVAFTFKQG